MSYQALYNQTITNSDVIQTPNVQCDTISSYSTGNVEITSPLICDQLITGSITDVETTNTDSNSPFFFALLSSSLSKTSTPIYTCIGLTFNPYLNNLSIAGDLRVEALTTAGLVECDSSGNFSSYAMSGDATQSAGVLTLATVNSNVGSFGSSTAVPVITVNGKGLITAVSTATVSSSTIATTATTANNVYYLTFVLDDTSQASEVVYVDGGGFLFYNPAGEVLTSANYRATTAISTPALTISSFGTAGVLHNDNVGNISSSLVSLTSDVTGTLPNSNTTATSSNTASAIVTRDGSGNFSAGKITATTLQVTGLSTGFVRSDGSGNFSSSAFSTADTNGLLAFGSTSMTNTNSCAFGPSALNVCTTGGDYNNAFGFACLSSCTTGKNNNGFGRVVLKNLTTGQQNCAFGWSAGSAYTSSESNNILIGYNVTGTLGESNICRIGNSSITDNYFFGIIHATTFSGALSGNATTATSATTSTTATNANNVNLANNTTNATEYLCFSATATGNQQINTNTSLTCNPSTGLITATTMTANHKGTIDTTTTATTQSSGTNNTTVATTAYVDVYWSMSFSLDISMFSNATFNGNISSQIYFNLTGNSNTSGPNSGSVTIRAPALGTYTMYLHYFKNTNLGKFQTSVNLTNVGSVIDQYSASSTVGVATITGITLLANDNTIQFNNTGKNASSSAYYNQVCAMPILFIRTA